MIPHKPGFLLQRQTPGRQRVSFSPLSQSTNDDDNDGTPHEFEQANASGDLEEFEFDDHGEETSSAIGISATQRKSPNQFYCQEQQLQ